MNIVLKGQRQDLKPDKVIATYYEDTRYLEKPKEFKPNGMDMLFFSLHMIQFYQKTHLTIHIKTDHQLSGEIRVGHTTVDEEDMDSEDGEHSHENCVAIIMSI